MTSQCESHRSSALVSQCDEGDDNAHDEDDGGDDDVHDDDHNDDQHHDDELLAYTFCFCVI